MIYNQYLTLNLSIYCIITFFFFYVHSARNYAEEAIARQKQAFQSWGVTANWSESECYFTNHSSYMKNELHQFIKLYEKDIIFRDFMPVYWSPSSR